jgi:hypothetical protein
MATKMNIGPMRADVLGGSTTGDANLATVYRVARLIVVNDEGFARLHRLSNGAVELSSGLDLNIGQAVRIDLSEAVSISATVSEKDGQRYNLRFEKSINCADMLRQLVAEARSSRARPLRLTTLRTTATVRSLQGVNQLELRDISQRGMKVRHDGSFRPGLRVLVRLPNGRECRGVVRWTCENHAGLQLIDMLSADELGAVSSLRKGPS